MLWKIYYIIIASFIFFGFYYQSTSGINAQFLIDLAFGVIPLLAGFSFAFKKRIFERKVWKILFWLILARLFFQLIMELQNAPRIYVYLPTLMIGFLGFSVFLPLYYAVYKLAYPAKR
ncbi:hypothetical protein HYS97_02535 [Candidatus Daviesbacteria bacterium]|nr:hypothetical protein [Candidatus Daviesbacteria bacterium]